MDKKQGKIVKILRKSKDIVLDDETKELIEKIISINEIVNCVVLKNEEVNLRVGSKRHREQLYFN